MKSRRQFLTGIAITGATLGTVRIVHAQEPSERLDLDNVGKFVGKSHGDLETVENMLKKQPALVNAAWDWGGGDWETGLGAASHVGRPDIAELLLASGARLDAFAATMLGLKPIVQEMLKSFPALHKVPGPHGIPLLSHAVFGRRKADDVFHLLVDAGADVNAHSNNGMTPLMAASSVGRPAIVEVLLEQGADPTVRDKKDRTALEIAIQREHKSVVKILKRATG